MAYVRQLDPYLHVYYGTGPAGAEGYVCLSCSIRGTTVFSDTAAILAHLSEHDGVPDWLAEDIEADREDAGVTG